MTAEVITVARVPESALACAGSTKLPGGTCARFWTDDGWPRYGVGLPATLEIGGRRMDSMRLTRREVIKRGAAVSVFVAIGGLDAATKASAAVAPSGATFNDVSGGIFSRAIDSQSAIVTLVGAGDVKVTLTPDAYVHHGAAEDPVADMTEFVPGERVAVRGLIVGQTVNAHEVQSVYTEEIGSLLIDSTAAATLEAAGGATVAAPGGPVRVPASVQTASGDRPAMRTGELAAATIWTNPATGERTAVLLTPQG